MLSRLGWLGLISFCSCTLFLVDEKVPFSVAEHICNREGGTLANLFDLSGSIEDDQEAFKEARKLIAGVGSAWIRSSDEDNSRCLQFTQQGIKRVACNEVVPVICEFGGLPQESDGDAEVELLEGEKGCRVPNRWTPREIDRQLCCPGPKPPCMPSSNDSQCYCTSSSTGTLIDCCCQYRLIKDWDFWRSYPKLGQDWSYYRRGEYVANGGSLVLGKRGAILNTSRYNKTMPQNPDLYADNYKYLILSDEAVPLQMDGDVVVQWVLSDAHAYLVKTEDTPFPCQIMTHPGQDFRTGGTVLMALDPALGFQFSYFVTTDMIYAIYARLPDQRESIGNYAAFTFVIPILYRLVTDQHKLKLILSRRTRTVRWQLGTRDVFRVTNVGFLADRQYMTLDLAGGEQDAFPTSIQYGLGAMDFLNHYPACWRICPDGKTCCFPPARQALVKTGDKYAWQQYSPIDGKAANATFWDEHGRKEYRLWGQGSSATIKRITIYWQDCKYRYVHKPKKSQQQQQQQLAGLAKLPHILQHRHKLQHLQRRIAH